ncbi:sporulation protein YqfD [Pelosinus sp. sgz500959]|uniref:sporulation protein YqfD n=1 Tax=Pelosinus sp. sgz500959 TaxID=3242472 RepID=UPI00366F7FDE
MTFKLFNYITGTITLKVSGAMPEKFINLCMTHQKRLLSISKHDEDFIVSMGLSDFFSIRPLVRKSQNHVQVIGYAGLPFLIRKIKKRKMLVAGGIVFLMLLNLLMSYIWFVDIVGIKSISAQQIKDVLYEQGLKPGMLKEKINSKKIENQIVRSIPEVAWVNIGFTGTRAVVEIVEKTLPKALDKAPADIVAAKDGIITEVIALAGESVVKKGDTVKKGDLLIKGVAYDGKTMTPNHVNTDPQLIRANGIVRARVWYEGYGETELIQLSHERTGQQYIGVKIRVGDRTIVLKEVAVSPDQLFEIEEVNKKLLSWRNTDIVVESIISTYYEVDEKTIHLSVEEAREQGKSKALAEIQALIPETAYVLLRTVEVLKTPETNLVRVKVNVETAEDIGQFMNVQ